MTYSRYKFYIRHAKYKHKQVPRSSIVTVQNIMGRNVAMISNVHCRLTTLHYSFLPIIHHFTQLTLAALLINGSA